ncbi:molybdate ABC transporter substrate-binding protein [Hahella sp. SMD15-11]|uniref:Molybdate ABC transporter substrate-binding protein n=1 Tax=Thermohahella caldifontis TaxID=3142973 RepID=A0AB39USI9_9GAMM
MPYLPLTSERIPPTLRVDALSRLLVLVALLAGLLPVAAAASTVNIAVASNFRSTMEDLVDTYRQHSGQTLRPAYGSTGKLYAQIRHGAPFAALFAADTETPARLVREGHALPDTQFIYARGRLVLWSPQPGLVDGEGRVLQQGGFRRLAIANPKLAPYGRAAEDVMQALGVWQVLQPRLVRGENVGQAFQYVASGAAELGFVAASQLDRGKPAGSVWYPPPSLYTPILQSAVMLQESPQVRAFFRFVRSEAGRAIIRQHGYDTP